MSREIIENMNMCLFFDTMKTPSYKESCVKIFTLIILVMMDQMFDLFLINDI